MDSLFISISTYDNDGNELFIDYLEIWVYTIPETTICKTSKILTDAGKAQSFLFPTEERTLQIVASAQGYTSGFSEIFSATSYNLDILTFTLSSSSIIINQEIALGLGLTQNYNSMSCDYTIYEADGQSIQGETTKLSVLGETQMLISFSSTGIRTLIVECASDLIYIKSCTIVVNKSELYTVVINMQNIVFFI